jgi:hypothetical protein
MLSYGVTSETCELCAERRRQADRIGPHVLIDRGRPGPAGYLQRYAHFYWKGAGVCKLVAFGHF